MTGYLARNFLLAPLTLKLVLSRTLVHSKVEYASSVWDTSLEFPTNYLASDENSDACLIFSNHSRLSSVPILFHLVLFQRLSGQGLFLKIYHYNQSLKSQLLSYRRRTSLIQINFIKQMSLIFSLNVFFLYLFVPKTSAEWNHLPTSIALVTVRPSFQNCH